MSHDEQIDLRVRRTHKFLQEAMIELISEQGFDATTVGDITQRAMVNRATFYRHFQDKYELVANIFEETTNQLVQRLKPFDVATLKSGTQHPVEIWIQVFAHVAEHDRLYRAMLGKNGSSWFATRMREHIANIMLEGVRQQELEQPVAPKSRRTPQVPQELPGLQLSHVLVGTITWWLESNKSYTPEQMATWFHRFAFHGYLAARGFDVPLPREE